MNQCAVCLSSSVNCDSGPGDNFTFVCSRCGAYVISRTAVASLRNGLLPFKNYIKERSLISHVVRKWHESGERVHLTTYGLENILKNASLPTVFESAENLIRFIGNNMTSLGTACNLSDRPRIGAIAGVLIPYAPRDVVWILESLMASGEVVKVGESDTSFRLTFSGWKRFEEIRKQRSESEKAFMAMKFVDTQDPLHVFVEQYLKPAVALTGFTLSNPLRSEPKAGNIDARMEVEIRNSKFLVADLSHGNDGSYWEAGFAHGLGKPVFYTCKKGVQTHFDTSHHTTIFWETGKEGEAAERLKAVIRTTLPGEVRMND